MKPGTKVKYLGVMDGYETGKLKVGEIYTVQELVSSGTCILLKEEGGEYGYFIERFEVVEEEVKPAPNSALKPGTKVRIKDTTYTKDRYGITVPGSVWLVTSLQNCRPDRINIDTYANSPTPYAVRSEDVEEVDSPEAPMPDYSKSAKILTLPLDSKERKDYPLYRGCLRYFPAALAGVAKVSKLGNDKHNPGEEMHHARGKSADHGDCLLRHLTDVSDLLAALQRGNSDVKPEDVLNEVSQMAWRALAFSQELHEQFGAVLAPGAKNE